MVFTTALPIPSTIQLCKIKVKVSLLFPDQTENCSTFMKLMGAKFLTPPFLRREYKSVKILIVFLENSINHNFQKFPD